MRAASIKHAEWEILQHILTSIDLTDVKRDIVTDKHSEDRFNKASAEICKLLENMQDRRAKHLPEGHEAL
jgi:hypothetical protein